jgi:hypothetical protein
LARGLDPQIVIIAKAIMSRAILPPKASIDALHIAIVAHHQIEYLYAGVNDG